jgi:uncharacterized protein (TIGR02145 family)
MKNKSLFIIIAITIIAMNSTAQVTGSFTDPRDGRVYKTVTIGTQTWMAENLAYKANSGCWASNDDTNNVAKYGYLYDWETAKVVCPAGWHLPTDAEWKKLIDFLGGESIAGTKLKSAADWDGTNISGFTALHETYVSGGMSSNQEGTSAYFWSATVFNATNAWMLYLVTGINKSFRGNDFKTSRFSIRCLKN